MQKTNYTQVLETPLGIVRVDASATHVLGVGFTRDALDGKHSPNWLTSECCCQLSEYFAGQRRAFHLPVNAQGSEFSLQVWGALLRHVGWGQRSTYGELAALVAKPRGARAIGRALGANPIGIIIPCHRVVGAGGALGGFGWGEERKEWLLAHEGFSAAG